MASDEASASFDPYHLWLGIPPADQPPNHYRLLGVSLFEDDVEVIRDAAERQSAHVRRYLNSDHRSYAEVLWHEIDGAKRCLLQPPEKVRYDEELRTAASLEFGDNFSINENHPVTKPKGVESDFDPYHRWLGIPHYEQPADHYCLLGLTRFEHDTEVIRNAAERQISHVRRYATGEHGLAASRILNELARARSCLLDANKRRVYEQQLRSEAGLPVSILGKWR